MKLIKVVATRCHFKAKMHQIRFRLWLHPDPDPLWGSLQRSPRTTSWISGVLLLVLRKRRGRSEGEERGKGRGKGHVLEEGREGREEGKERGREVPHFACPLSMSFCRLCSFVILYFLLIWLSQWTTHCCCRNITVVMSSLTLFPSPPPSSVFTICEKNSDLVTVTSLPAQVWFFAVSLCKRLVIGNLHVAQHPGSVSCLEILSV